MSSIGIPHEMTRDMMEHVIVDEIEISLNEGPYLRGLSPAFDRGRVSPQKNFHPGLSHPSRQPKPLAPHTPGSHTLAASERQRQVLCSVVRIDGYCFGLLATMGTVRCRFPSFSPRFQ